MSPCCHSHSRSGAKIGKSIDLKKLKDYKKQIKLAEIQKKKDAKIAKRKEAEAKKEFWKALNELNITQRKHGLKPSYYGKMWTQNIGSLDQMRADRGDKFEEA